MSTIIRLTDSILTIQGTDAHKFLQGQTTTDFKEVSPEQSRLGGYANLKGRLIFSFRAIEWPAQQLNLVIDKALLNNAQSILQKFIVFSKAHISTPDTHVMGLLGAEFEQLLLAQFGFCPTKLNQTISNEQVSITRLHGESRWLLLVKAEFSDTIWTQLSQQSTIGSVNDWRLAQIAAGETPVLPETTELYQPQELNFLALDAISYNKGCYTGQEIIARLYFRGKLKQWAHRFNIKLRELPALNTVIYDEFGHSQGHVVLAAQADAESVELLAIVRHDYADKVFLGEDKQPLALLPLPYVVEVKE